MLDGVSINAHSVIHVKNNIFFIGQFFFLQKKKEKVANNLFLGERQKQNGFCIKKWAYEVAEQCKEIFFNKKRRRDKTSNCRILICSCCSPNFIPVMRLSVLLYAGFYY